MTTEIKVVQNSVNQALSTLSSSAQTLKTPFSKEISRNNQMDLVEKIGDINKTYASLIQQYKTLLLNNIEVTNETVEAIAKMDENIATSMIKSR